jgi:uncharacterized protein YbbK (DUF523 family)
MMQADLAARYARLHGEDWDGARQEVEALKATGRPVAVVSACLLGVRCRYDGGDKAHPAAVARHAADAEILPLCPEVLARLGVPRPAIVLTDEGRARTADGRDVTTQLEAGATLAERLADLAGASRALLKERSPSCGCRRVHGAPDGGLRAGEGRFAARLRARGLPLASEEDV